MMETPGKLPKGPAAEWERALERTMGEVPFAELEILGPMAR